MRIETLFAVIAVSVVVTTIAAILVVCELLNIKDAIIDHSIAVADQTRHLSVKAPEKSFHMPDPQLTPGVIDKNLTIEEICVRGSAAERRHVTQAVKKEVFKRYGITNPKPGQYEIDHLFSIELGGRNDIENLWPQPYDGPWNAHMKDKLENKLHLLMCRGEITQEEAIAALSPDWVEGYEKYISN